MKKLLVKNLFAILALFCFCIIDLSAQQQRQGSISGIIVEKISDSPLEFATVILKSVTDTTYSQGTVTGKKGEFGFSNLSFGDYKLIYSFIGFDKVETTVFSLSSKKSTIDLGRLFISESTTVLGDISVVAQRSTFVNSIDRRTFNVGQDVMSKTGTVSELLQNVPSVQVDLEGNVSLRGSDNVMFLINGKPSSLMGTNRAAVLQQMPASSIEKIEIITNPSAKYKPDGTSGIINIVLKKDKNLGLNGQVSINAGNDSRYNGNFSVNYNPGKINVFTSYSFRQDDRLRYSDDYMKHYISGTDTIRYIHILSRDHSRPLSHIIQTGLDYKIDDKNSFGVTANYNYRSFIRHSNDANLWQSTDMTVLKNYDRSRRDPEFERDLELSGNFVHSFAKDGHELTIDYTTSFSKEQEDNHYSDIYRVPVTPTTYDNTLIKQGDNESQFSVTYSNPASKDIKIETGYIIESRKNDMDFFVENYDNDSSLWVKDLMRSNHFVYTENIHVLFGTYEQQIGKLGLLAGMRAEQAFLNAHQITTDTIMRNKYFRIYPSLHISYKLNDINELQLNYSHRIRRPEGDEMNPFPEYADPYNLRQGNPKLKPADVHSIEMGYQYKKNSTTFLSTLYYRYTYNGMTDLTRYLNDTVKLTTRENLSKSGSAGLEMVLAKAFGTFGSINLSTNTFYNRIDASNLGYSSNKSIITWSANLSAGINLSRSAVLQITSSYSAERLTPQGKQLPSFVINTGLKKEFLNRKLVVIATVSDVFNSLKNKSIIDTPELYEKTIRTRSARIIYAGITYSFGNQKKKKEIEYDNRL